MINHIFESVLKDAAVFVIFEGPYLMDQFLQDCDILSDMGTIGVMYNHLKKCVCR